MVAVACRRGRFGVGCQRGWHEQYQRQHRGGDGHGESAHESHGDSVAAPAGRVATRVRVRGNRAMRRPHGAAVVRSGVRGHNLAKERSRPPGCPCGDRPGRLVGAFASDRAKDDVSTGIGDTLKEAREAQGRTIEDVARVVRARMEQLRALEEERFDAFPGEVYAKGFLRSYAVELGLDPGPLLETFRTQVSNPEDIPASTLVTGNVPQGPRRSTPPPWLAWVLVGVLVVAGLGFLGMISTRFAPETASPDEPSGPPPAPAPPAEEGTPLPEPEPEPEPEPTFDGVEVIVALEESSWMRVTVDGAVVLEQVVDAGETLQYQADSEILLRLGNAGGVRLEVNGEDLGSPGGRGQVAEVRYTIDDVPVDGEV